MEDQRRVCLGKSVICFKLVQELILCIIIFCYMSREEAVNPMSEVAEGSGRSPPEQNDEGPVQEGRWASDEHQRFLVGIMQFGKDWREVEKVVKTRTGSQVRSHAQKYFIKLNRIRKERKKQKSKLPPEPTELEQEVISRFTESDISEKTPTELITLIRETSGGKCKTVVTSERVNLKTLVGTLKHRERALQDEISFAQKKQEEQSKNLNQLLSQKNDVRETKNFLEAFSCYQEEQEESYLVWIIRHKFKPGGDFRDLIDFGFDPNSNTIQGSQMDARIIEDMQSEVTGIRKKSFTLPDECEDEKKLQETLEKVRKGDEME